MDLQHPSEDDIRLMHVKDNPGLLSQARGKKDQAIKILRDLIKTGDTSQVDLNEQLRRPASLYHEWRAHEKSQLRDGLPPFQKPSHRMEQNASIENDVEDSL